MKIIPNNLTQNSTNQFVQIAYTRYIITIMQGTSFTMCRSNEIRLGSGDPNPLPNRKPSQHLSTASVFLTKNFPFWLTKTIFRYIINVEKGKTSNGYATKRTILTIAACARGGYCAFMGNIIIKIINTKSAISNFFFISTMLTFHKHTPFHRLGISACEYKSVGITAGVNTVKKSRL